MRGSVIPVLLLALALGCGVAKPPAGEPATDPAADTPDRTPLTWHDHTGPDKAYTARFPGVPEKVTTRFEYDPPRDHLLGPQTAKGTTYRVTVDRVTYELTEYEGMPEVFDWICDRLRGEPSPVPNGTGGTDPHGVGQRTAEIETTNPPGRMTLRHVQTYQRKLYELRVTVPAGADPGDTPKTFLDSFRLAPFPLSVAGKVPPFLAAAVDPAAGVMFITTTDGWLTVYDYPGFTERATYHLVKVGTRLALDSRRGVLWAILCEPRDMRDYRPDDPRPWDRVADRGVGRVTALDVRSVLAKDSPAERPKQLAELPDPVLPGRLTVSPDGRWLYYLDVGDHTPPPKFESHTVWRRPTKQVRLGRVNLETRERDRVLDLADGTEDLAVPPDGKALYATASPRGHDPWRGHNDPLGKRKPLHGLVQVIDPAAFKVTDTIEIDADPFSAAATDTGRVYITGGSDQHTDLVVVDVRQRKVVSRWPGIIDFSQIDMTPDGKWLALSPHTAPGFVEVYDLRRNPLGHDKGDVEDRYWFLLLPPADRYGGSDYSKDIGFGVICTPDGRYILDRRGGILRLDPK